MAERPRGREAEYELACRWATGWLHASRRVVPPATRPQGVLLFDSSPRLDLESLHVQALELGLRRAGFRTLLLAFDLPPERVVRAIRALDPTAFVFCGGEATLDVVGRLVYTVRQVGSAAPVFEYRESMPVTGDHGIPSLGSAPIEAVDRLKAYVDSGRIEQVVMVPEEAAASAAKGPDAPRRTLVKQSAPRRTIARVCLRSSSAIRSPTARCRRCCAPRRPCASGWPRSWSAKACPPPASPRSSCSPPPAARSSCARCGAGWAGARPTPPRSPPRWRRATWSSAGAYRRTAGRSAIDLSFSGRRLVERLFPAHADRVERAFGVLDADEKRELAELCRKLAA